MQQQVALLASSSESIISAWDLHTGMQLGSYKHSATPRSCMCLAGPDYIVAAQSTKDTVHFWTWHKDQVLQRSFTREPITALAASPDGAFLAGGGVSGAVYVWELASGRLLRDWAAHYKAVTALAFSPCGCLLVSGSEDTMVCAWVLADMVDTSMDTSQFAAGRPQPLHAWSGHTLPVTGLHVTQGGAPAAAIVASASLDRTVKLHALHTGRLLAVAAAPAAVTCVALDAGEHVVWAGASDGAVYEFSLVGEVADGDAAPTLNGHGSGASALDLLGARHPVLHPHAKMAGHTAAVTSMAVSPDGEMLLTGSEDGTALVWDARSRQAVRPLPSPSKLPVSAVLVLPRPAHLTPGGGGGAADGARTGPLRLAPLAPLLKYANMTGGLQPWESAPVILDGSADCVGDSASDATLWPPPALSPGSDLAWLAPPPAQALPRLPHDATGEEVQGERSGLLDADADDEFGILAPESQLALARQEAADWRALYTELHAYSVRHVLGTGGDAG